MGELTKTPTRALTVPRSKGGSGLALINRTLSKFAEPLQMLSWCQAEMDHAHVYLGDDEPGDARYLAPARHVLNQQLRHYASACAAATALRDIVADRPSLQISQASAVKMLGALIGALSKQKNPSAEDTATLLLSCADMFDPVSNAVAATTGFWKSVGTHPLLRALATKRLLAKQKWTLAPSELREEMEWVRDSLDKRLRFWVEPWIAMVERADRIVFEHDRAAWQHAYHAVPSSVPRGGQHHRPVDAEH
jgi:hypothetical protein